MPNNIIDSIRLSGTTYQIQGSGGGGTQAIELTQAQYDALVDKDPNVFYIITDAEAGDLTNYYTKTETNTLLGDKANTATTYTKTEVDTALGDKQDTLVSGTNIKTINNTSLLGSGNIDIQGGAGTVESAITSGSTNAVESKAIWSATTYNKGVLLTFNGNRESTNYPEGCGKLVVGNIGFGSCFIDFLGNDMVEPCNIHIDNNNWQGISVDVNFDGATYEIDGTTVIINYPSTDITFVQVGGETGWTYTAVVEGVWVNENTYMNVEVDAIASGLQNNINSKLDATAYTPTVVDSALNVTSQNPVQNQALYSELRINEGETETTLTFENSESTNYPNGCTKLNVEVVGSGNYSIIDFFNDDGPFGNIRIDNWGSINVNNTFDGASYEISGTTVIITYPTVTNVTRIRTDGIGNYVYKAITSLTTPLKDQVVANTTALGGKQDTLVSGTNIKTINNESILGSGNIDIQGGGGKAVSGGTNISITTGETADTINCTLNLENGTNSQSGGIKLKSSVAGNGVSGRDACAFGGANQANGINSFVTGFYNTGNTANAFVSGYRNITTNDTETLFGLWAVSNGSQSDPNGHSDATLLAVGNGEWRSQTRHNAFEIRQNGDIYVPNTDDTSTANWYQKPMVRLQDTITATAANTTALGGLSLIKLTQAEYDALATKDSNTLYVIVN